MVTICMATFVPKNVDIPVDGIVNGTITNDDGHGWAVASKNGMFVGKSMDSEVALADFIKCRSQEGPDSLGLFHSRFATHGVLDEFNVHPFWADEWTVVAHNGILPKHWLPEKGDKRSDTRILVDVTIPSLLGPKGIPSRRKAKILGDAIGLGNKLVILSVKSGEPKVRIVNAWQGIHESGVWYSNSGFRDIPRFTTGYYGGGYTFGGSWRDQKDKEYEDLYGDWPCEVCQCEGTVEMATMICANCQMCNDCYMDERFCRCLEPWAPVGGSGEEQLVEMSTSKEVVPLREGQNGYLWEQD